MLLLAGGGSVNMDVGGSEHARIDPDRCLKTERRKG